MFKFFNSKWTSFNCLTSLNWNYHIPISCFWTYIDPTFKMFKNVHFVLSGRYSPIFKTIIILLNGSSRFVGLRLFQNSPKLRFQKKKKVSRNSIFQKLFGIFLNYFEYPGVSKDKKNWFGESWTRPEMRTTINVMTFRVFPNWNRKVTSPKMKQKKIYGAFWLFFSIYLL